MMMNSMVTMLKGSLVIDEQPCHNGGQPAQDDEGQPAQDDGQPAQDDEESWSQ